METKKLEVITKIPSGVEVIQEGFKLTLKGPKGEVAKRISDKSLKVAVSGDELTLSFDKNSKKQKKNLHTTSAHVTNMIKGVTEGFNYKLKICSGHFPMTVAVKGDIVEVKNFIGESVPRRLTIKPGAEVKINGEIIDVTSIDKELAGQTAASIEKMTKRPGFDKRIFQDGIYIIEKDGRVL
jgi:large subunit ribosomal protein L6